MLYNGTLVLNARHAPFEAKGFADLYGRQIILYQISLKKKRRALFCTGDMLSADIVGTLSL